ncbi:Rap guanine nucleotide exchange factor 4 [Desmophyllum pertusum]|uniref:Rap guanine nucleotide exchange factor 4 n=1 Tax=Desmophyllum pertusum TaxID=174260 RepID=A0A9W9ZXR0_9CNID|nr:Rap guanine nucleotide exchange factor 4 [Desmophyllum pertusum]
MVAEWISCLEKRPANRTGEDLDIIYARLKDLKAFERFHCTVLQQICYYGYYQDLEEGITLFRQGDIGYYWYAVITGSLDVSVSETGKFEDAKTICSLGPGKVFGESILDDTPRYIARHSNYERILRAATSGEETFSYYLGAEQAVSRGYYSHSFVFFSRAQEKNGESLDANTSEEHHTMIWVMTVNSKTRTSFTGFVVDEKQGERPGEEPYSEEDLDDVLLMLSRSGPDAQLRMALRKSFKKELASAFVFESHDRKGTVLFNEGEEGISWYIILKGSVNVVVHGKGVVCQLKEGDDFGKLALVNNALRTLKQTQFVLKNNGQDVLVLEKMNIRNIFGAEDENQAPQMQKYSVMAGTPEKMVEYLLETRMDNTNNFDERILFIIGLDENRNITTEHKVAIKRRIVQMTLRWCYLAGNLFLEDKSICSFIEELMKSLEADHLINEFNLLRTAIFKLHERFPMEEMPDGSLSTQKGRLPLRRMGVANITRGLSEYKSIRGIDQKRVPFKPHKTCVTTGLSVNGRLFIAPREHLDSLTPTPEQEGPTSSNITFLESVGSKELAYYISQYDYELFNAVNIHEFIFNIFGKENYNQITANLDLLLKRFNEVQLWVETQILLTQQLNKRVYLLKKFIKLAAHCKEYKNWYSFFAIVMGLNSVAVSRLSQTWEKLPSKFRKIYEEFETTLEPSRNHRVYRLLAGKMKPPMLPFMPLLMKDMTFTNVGNKTQFDDLVNFEKMRMISSTIRLIQYCRSEPFNRIRYESRDLCRVPVRGFIIGVPGNSEGDSSIQKETQTSDGSLLKGILGGRNKRQLRELCDQSYVGCIIQDFTAGNKKQKKRRKKRKNRYREKNNKRKMEKPKTEPTQTCPHFVDAPTDDGDDVEDDGEQCPQAQQHKINQDDRLE